MSILLSLILVFGMLAVMPVSTASADTTYETYALDNVQGGAVLHCFNWSYNNIKAALPDIAKAGYTAVQTSPVQRPKEYNASYTDSGNWYKLYQPLGFSIAANGTTWYGTKAELTSMCNEAEKYGIKVIVDVVANHLANNGTDGGTYSYLHKDVESDLKNANYYHTNNTKTNENSRYNITQYHLGMPDLNTAESHVQQRVQGLLEECIDCGVDGFRFDAAKHIELPTDASNFKSNFWPNVLNGATDYAEGKGVEKPFYYGEILKSAGPNFPISNYTDYMAVTDNETGDRALDGAYLKDAEKLAKDNYVKGASAKDSILWVESHDTYMGNSGSATLSNTKNVTSGTINKAWAIVGARADSTSLFFARPSNTMGAASTDTNWKSSVVTEVNKFKNYFAGTNEHLAYSEGYNTAYIERGTKGVVISKENSGAVSLNVYQMADGYYKDQLTGNTFTVSNGTIFGTVGSTGVAVVYGEGDPSGETLPTEPTTPPKNTYTVYAVNNAGWNNVNIYWWGGSSNTVAWPGVEMTSISGKKVYSYELPKDAAGIVFNNGSGKQTVDITAGFRNGAVWTIDDSTATDGKYNISSAPDYYMVGTMNNWTNEDEYKFSINPSAAGKLEYKLSGVQLSANAELKVHSSADVWYPSGSGGNYKVTQAGTYDVYFRPEGDGDSSWYQNLVFLDAVPQEVTITYNYNVYNEETGQPVSKSVSKTVSVGNYTYDQLVELNKPYIKSPYYEYGEATFERNGAQINATIPNTEKKYTVTLNGVEQGEYKYMQTATVGTGEQKSFIVNGNVVFVGGTYKFYVCDDTDITTGDPSSAVEYALIDLNNVCVTDNKVELDMLATANIGDGSFERMGVAFALSEKTENEIKNAVLAVPTGTDTVDKIAVHNSSVDWCNQSGQYQFRYAPYFSKDKAKDAVIYFYTYVIDKDGNIKVSDAVQYDMRNLLA